MYILVCVFLWLIACLYACAQQIKLLLFSQDTHVMASVQQKQTFEFGGLVLLQRLRNKICVWAKVTQYISELTNPPAEQ